MVVRVQKLYWAPFRIGTVGVSNQLLIVPVPAVLLKLAPMYEFGAPLCDGNTVGLPWKWFVTPKGSLLFCLNQPGRFVMSSKPWKTWPHVGGVAEAVVAAVAEVAEAHRAGR